MGNASSSSSQRQRVIQPPPYTYPPANVFTPSQVTQYYPYGQTNGQYYGGGAQPQFMQYPPPPAYQPPYLPQQYGQVPRQVQTEEYTRTATIKNQVNLKKATLKVTPTEDDPSVLSISFRFDATAPCRLVIFINAKEEKRTCKVHFQGPAPIPVTYGKGLDQKFSADGSTNSMGFIHTAQVSLNDLTQASGERYPVLIRLEALTDEGRAEGQSLDAVVVGEELPKWVQSQTTYAKLCKEQGSGAWGIRLLKQKIWVKGEAFELQEIYGMEAKGTPVDAAEDELGGVDGTECVICMSAPRDTTALPCRHMCMCHQCASALKHQTNKCPICRNEIDSLLHIKINRPRAGSTSETSALADS